MFRTAWFLFISVATLSPVLAQDWSASIPKTALSVRVAESPDGGLILAGFMRILSPWFVNHFSGRILNIHPALLPAYPGLDTHQRVLDAGDKWHGSTVHFVTEELDAGPLILQGRLAVRDNECAADLATRVQALEHQIYPAAAAMFAAGSLSFDDNCAYLDGERLLNPITEEFN